MFSNIFKYLLGFILALAILAGSTVAAALYFMNQASKAPPKPIYANDEPEVRASAGFDVNKNASKTPGANSNTAASEKKAESTPTPTPTQTPEKADKKEPKPLPPGAYNARVTWSQGLSLRSEPKTEAERVGGVGFNQKVIVIEESDDKVWQKVRLEGSDTEGWVKAGNTQKDDGQNDDQR
jgi:uncharacterized protein YgiM (DUF1202 family)